MDLSFPPCCSFLVHVACTKKVEKKWNIKWKKGRNPNEIKGFALLLGVQICQQEYMFVLNPQTEQAYERWNLFKIFFSNHVLLIEPKSKVCDVHALTIYPVKIIKVWRSSFPVWFKPYLIVLSWCSQVPSPQGKVLPLRKQEFLPNEWSPNWQT